MHIYAKCDDIFEMFSSCFTDKMEYINHHNNNRQMSSISSALKEELETKNVQEVEAEVMESDADNTGS